MHITRKSIFVTGAGSGIGRATAVALARKGARLTLSGRRKEPLEETARLVREAGGEALVLAGDVSDETWQQSTLRQIVAHFGGLDGIVNSAGSVSAGELETIEPGDIRKQVEVNLIAPILLIRAALPSLRQSEAAVIVNVSSSIGLVGMPFYAPYAATKGGLARFGEALRRELSDERVHVMTVYPSATDTPMMETADSGDKAGYETPEAVADALVAGLENDAIDVIRGGDDFIDLVKTNHDNPRKADSLIEEKKASLEQRAARHRSM
ncbi:MULTISPECIES: SDR family NAD(P)-dependent oxidoreductase [Halomonadaceae]|uniref:Ketoreductase domain-containing protein n=1 Tax=Modicisalibacter zincidurans TaxID=1178777 RepID=A0ABP9RDX9_9GAMM|nr:MULTISPECIES: SDR family oxidoreductase [Halomonas]MCD6007487.1 SDR family oxidoreductase [Halomonas sp. IOP_31]